VEMRPKELGGRRRDRRNGFRGGAAGPGPRPAAGAGGSRIVQGCDQATGTQRSRQPPDECGEHGLVRPLQTWLRIGTAQHCDLLPQHEQLNVLGGGRAVQQQDQFEHLAEDQILQPQRHGDDHARTAKTGDHRW